MTLRCTAIVLLGLLSAACSSRNGDRDDSNSPGSGGSGSSPVDLTDACEAACVLQVDCGMLVSYPDCVASCLSSDRLYDDDCVHLVAKEAQCFSELSCDELSEYLEGRSGHGRCGGAFDSFASGCAINGGVPPAACDRFCAAANDCGLPVPPEQGCAENCLLTLTGQALAAGSDCADVQIEGFDCIAEQTCDEISAAISANITPAACAHLDERFVAACQ